MGRLIRKSYSTVSNVYSGFLLITYMHTCATDQWTLTMEEDLEKMSKGNVLVELRKDFGKQPQLL